MLDFSQNGINLIIDVKEDKSVVFLEFSKNAPKNTAKKSGPHFSPVQLQLTGVNNCDHSFGKHNGTSGSRDLKYVSHKYFENKEGNKLEMLLSDGKINVTLHYQFYNGIACVRAWTSVENISDESVGLEYVSSFVYNGFDGGDKPLDEKIRVMIAHNAWCKEANWKTHTLSDLGYERCGAISWKKISVSNSGTWSAKDFLPMGAVLNTQTENTFLWQIENNGSWQWEISDAANMMYFCLSGPTEQENQWHKELGKGECFESVKVCVSLGEDFDKALEELTKYRRKIINKSETDKKLPVIFNDYMNCLMAEPTEENELPIIDLAAEMGAEYYCMDAGWYADGAWWDSVGEWQESKKRFPNGLKKIFDYIREKGMIPGIWLEIEVMGINCPLVKEFDDDCFFMRHGRRVIDSGRYQLDFRSPKVREHATRTLDRVVKDYGVQYIKNDYNIEAGLGTQVDSDSVGDGLLGHNRAYRAWIEEMKLRHPSLVWENCASGGMRMDYCQLSIADVQSTSDQQDYKITSHVAAAAATAVLPEQAAVWAYPIIADDENAFVVNMVNALPLRIHLSGEIFGWQDDKKALVKEAIDCYKATRDGISEAIPFYPLGVPQYSDKNFCSAYRIGNDIRLAVWRLGSDLSELDIPIENAKNMSAKVLYPSNTKATVKMTDSGIKVTLPEDNSAVYIELKSI